VKKVGTQVSQPNTDTTDHQDQPQRAILPIPDVTPPGLTTYDAKDPEAEFPPFRELRPPEDAPNVLVILLDDVGFGASSAFGGACETPVAERLASGGLRYNRFHTTALCTPTRQALLTGRNHHSVGAGTITEFATSAPGYTSLRPNNKAPLTETLKLNGYSTAQFGKCHEVPHFRNAPMVGPFDMWPTSSGFEYFYGFIGFEADQWHPTLTENTTPVEPPGRPEEGYHLTEDLADRAIDYLRTQHSLVPDKPFFIYFAPGACHSPHHVPQEWIRRYEGAFAHGWDRQREITFARQKELGVIPPDAELTASPEGLPAWEEMAPELRPVLERGMETYAAFLSHTDHHVGRVIDAIDELGVLENTLIYYILGDNGASPEGTMNGTFNEWIAGNGFSEEIETPEFLLANLEKWGSPEAYNQYAAGWAWAMDCPFQWTKQVASHWGGTRNGTIVHWPRGISQKGGVRSQFCHVIDFAPTVLEVAGIPEPSMVNGVLQSPYEGTSMLYTFDAPEEPERHKLQYFEMLGNRGIYFKGWSAVTKHRTPWKVTGEAQRTFDEDVWELYDGSSDYSQAHDLSREMPEKLRELQRLWLIEAAKYNVLPLDDRYNERINPELAGRPDYITGNEQTLFPGMKRLTETSVLNIKNKSFQITAQLIVPHGGANGTIFAQGGRFGGWGLMMHEGAARFVYNLVGVEVSVIDAEEPLPAGEHQVRAEFAYDGGGLAKGGTVTLYYDGEQTGQGTLAATAPIGFSPNETAGIGHELGTTVLPGTAPADTVFNGKISWVRLTTGQPDNSDMVDPEDVINMLMAEQ
jgi:arylsulfatase A-like enzyme